MANRALWRAMVRLWAWVFLASAPTLLAVAGTPGRHGHHQGCKNGQCVPHCPVKPGQYGYHGTQWRRWPAAGIETVSAVSDAMPVRPPRSVVPGPDEESPRRIDDDDAANPDNPDKRANPEDPGQAGSSAADPQVFQLPAAPEPVEAAVGDGAQVPLPLDFRGVDARPTRAVYDEAGSDGGGPAEPSRGWRQFLDVSVASEDVAPDGDAPDGDAPTVQKTSGEGVPAAPTGAKKAAAATTTVAPVAFFPPRPPSEMKGSAARRK